MGRLLFLNAGNVSQNETKDSVLVFMALINLKQPFVVHSKICLKSVVISLSVPTGFLLQLVSATSVVF